MQKIRCLIIEDEPLAARIISDYINQCPELELVSICTNAFAALAKIDTEQVDLLFLDINLPKVNGFEFIKTLQRKFYIIVTTAYPQYAIEGFELEVIDYLLKPISFIRFSRAISKVIDIQKRLHQTLGNGDLQPDYIFVKVNGKLEKVFFNEILYIESMLNYVVIYKSNKKIITYSSLKNIETHLPHTLFKKVQKSFIVAINKINGMHRSKISIGNIEINVSRKLLDELRKLILTNNLSDGS